MNSPTDADLINAYIEVLNEEVAAQTKAKLTLQARLKVTEAQRDALLTRVAELEATLAKKKPKTDE